MKKAQFFVDLKKEGLTTFGNYLIAKGLLSNKVLPFNLNRLAFSNKKELKGWFSLVMSYLESLNKVFSVNLVTVGVGYKFFTPKHARFLSTVVLKMGYGGSELAKKVPNYIRARAKKSKLILISNERDKLGSFAQALFSLKRPVPYTGKGIKYKDQLVFLKKRKQQQKSK